MHPAAIQEKLQERLGKKYTASTLWIPQSNTLSIALSQWSGGAITKGTKDDVKQAPKTSMSIYSPPASVISRLHYEGYGE
mgnify:CR=1 FL=1